MTNPEIVEVPNGMFEITLEVSSDEVDGGFSASALGFGIHTQGGTVEELRLNVSEAVECYVDETMTGPNRIRLHFVERGNSEICLS